jgi:hypothetical protein
MPASAEEAARYFDTEEGRRDYEAALAKHLQDNRILSGAATFGSLSSSADIAKLADAKFAKLVLIVHGAGDAPAIAVDLGNAAAGIKGDWIKADKFAALIAPFGFDKKVPGHLLLTHLISNLNLQSFKTEGNNP